MTAYDREDEGSLKIAIQKAIDLRVELESRGIKSKAYAPAWGWREMAAATIEAYGLS